MKAEKPSADGFTLLELLISLTIMGIILVIIFGSLRIGVRAWEKGETDIEAQQRERVVLNLIKGQISSICAREIKIDNEEPVLFKGKGDDRTLTFVSRLPAMPDTLSGMVYVHYVVESIGEGYKQLTFHEQDVVTMGTGDMAIEPERRDFHVLIPKAYDISFDYLKGTQEGDGSTGWEERWNPDPKEEFPKAVRITFRRDKDAPSLHVIAPIYLESSSKES